MTERTRYYQILESAPAYADDVADLASWSQNYDHPTPFALFLDIIGYSDEHFGAPMFNLEQAPAKIGYVEIGKLADALAQYADDPTVVTEWIDTLMSANGVDEEYADASLAT